MRLLLVEDQPDAARILAKGLREQAYAVDVVHDGESASYEAAIHDYDVVVLDVMLPGRDGFAVARDLRRAGSAVPILMLTARDDIEARVAGLDAGADDYLTKPFDFRELLARLRALIRRGGSRRRLRICGRRLGVRGGGRRVLVKGRARPDPRASTPCSSTWPAGRTPSSGRADIAEHVWDDRYDSFSNVIDVYVQRLRRKLLPGGRDTGSARAGAKATSCRRRVRARTIVTRLDPAAPEASGTPAPSRCCSSPYRWRCSGSPRISARIASMPTCAGSRRR